jgi:hypothetical protein
MYRLGKHVGWEDLTTVTSSSITCQRVISKLQGGGRW